MFVSGGMVLPLEFPKFIHVALKSKYSDNSTNGQILFLFTTGMMKQIALDLVLERPHIYKLHTICYRTRLVYHMDEFWTIIDRDCPNKSTVDRIFVCLAYWRVIVSVNYNSLSWETSRFMSNILIKFGANRKRMLFKGNVHRMADRMINTTRNNGLISFARALEFLFSVKPLGMTMGGVKT